MPERMHSETERRQGEGDCNFREAGRRSRDSPQRLTERQRRAWTTGEWRSRWWLLGPGLPRHVPVAAEVRLDAAEEITGHGTFAEGFLEHDP